jgi:DeoR/GlpR family transcriptional regulator of sugar metabolism
MPKRSRINGEPMLGEARRAAIADMLRAAGSVTVAEVQEQLGVSPMTARRDLAELSRRGLAHRTHGGAVVPSISVHEDSFTQRLEAEPGAKRLLAEAAVGLLNQRDAVFVDSSTTSYFVARRILELGLEITLVTNSLPVMQLVAAQAPTNVELVAVGGLLRTLTQSFVGPHAIRTVEGHFTDHAFVSIRALMNNGLLADVDPLEAEVKRAMIAQANESILLIDRSKLSARGLNAIGPVSDVSLVLGHGMEPADLRMFHRLGVPVRVVDDQTARNGGDAATATATGVGTGTGVGVGVASA